MKVCVNQMTLFVAQNLAAGFRYGAPHQFGRMIRPIAEGNEALAMRSAAKVKTFTAVTLQIFEGKRARDYSLRFQRFKLSLPASLCRKHAEHVVFQ